MTTPEPGENWGILGGTFDPVHNGHITLALDCLEAKNLDGVLCIPSFLHPFKKSVILASFEERIEMLRLAIGTRSKLTFSTIEQDEDLSGFTIDTIRTVKKLFPNTYFYFIIGADNLSQLYNWHKPEEIIKEIKILAGNRPQYDLEIDEEYRHAIEFVDSSFVDIASTTIKQRIKSGHMKSLSEYLDKDVLAYIEQRKLYR